MVRNFYATPFLALFAAIATVVAGPVILMGQDEPDMVERVPLWIESETGQYVYSMSMAQQPGDPLPVVTIYLDADKDGTPDYEYLRPLEWFVEAALDKYLAADDVKQEVAALAREVAMLREVVDRRVAVDAAPIEAVSVNTSTITDLLKVCQDADVYRPVDVAQALHNYVHVDPAKPIYNSAQLANIADLTGADALRLAERVNFTR